MLRDFNIVLHFIILPGALFLALMLFLALLKTYFRSLRLSLMFFLFGLTLLGYFYIYQFIQFNFYPSLFLQPWLSKIFLFTVIISGAVVLLKLLDDLITNKYFLGRKRVEVPPLFREVLIFTVLVVIVLVILKMEFGLNLTGILTSSAIISVIIGLALQDTLSNIIAGIVLHFEKPFKIGDWIKTGIHEGEIVQISWRATRLKTLEGNYIIIPNVNISKETILNFYEPNKAHAIIFPIGIEYGAPPLIVKEVLLRSVQDSQGVLKIPSPLVRITSFGDFAVQYEVKIWVDDHSRYKDIMDEVMTKIWYRLGRNDIQIPFPIRTVTLKKDATKRWDLSGSKETRINFIRKIELFSCLSDDDIDLLARRSKIHHFIKDERIIVQGEAGESLYLLIKGSVKIISTDSKGNIVPIRDLKEGEYFGEMSLLTGEKRSATVVALDEVSVLEIASEDLLPLIQENPNLMETLSQILAERRMMTRGAVDQASLSTKNLEKESLSKSLFGKIKDFFSGKATLTQLD